MRSAKWRKWALLLTSGGTLMQVASCAEAATVVTAWSSVLTTAGLFYLIYRIVE